MQSTWLPLTLHLSCSFFFGQGGKERIPVLQEVSLRERIANSRVRVKGKSPRKLKNCGKRLGSVSQLSQGARPLTCPSSLPFLPLSNRPCRCPCPFSCGIRSP